MSVEESVCQTSTIKRKHVYEKLGVCFKQGLCE